MSKYCPFCGEELKDEAKFCKSCGKSLEDIHQGGDDVFKQPVNTQQTPIPQASNNHKIAIILGYICAILIPLFGLIFGIYLVTRNDANAKKHGKFVILISVVIWALSFMMLYR